jgi:hypothetical protein
VRGAQVGKYFRHVSLLTNVNASAIEPPQDNLQEDSVRALAAGIRRRRTGRQQCSSKTLCWLLA